MRQCVNWLRGMVAQPIGTLAYWQIGKLFNCNASFIFTFRIIAVLFFIDNKPLY